MLRFCLKTSHSLQKFGRTDMTFKFLIVCLLFTTSVIVVADSTTETEGKALANDGQNCLKLAAPLHGRITCTNATHYGSICEIHCQEKFSVRGSRCRRCNSNKIWSGFESTCQPINGCHRKEKEVRSKAISPAFVQRSCCPPGTNGVPYNPATHSCCYGGKYQWLTPKAEFSSYDCDCCQEHETECWTCCDEEIPHTKMIDATSDGRSAKRLDVTFKIVGGTAASFEARRSNAYLVYKRDLWGNPPIPGFPPICGGVLIHPSWILTARHCVSDSMCGKQMLSSSALRVIVGKKNSSILAEEDGQERDVRIAVCHEHYCKNRVKPDLNDIAMLLLSSPIDMSEPSVALATLPNLGQQVDPWTNCLLTGWGLERRIRIFPLPDYEKWVNEYIKATPATLQQVVVPVVPSQYCRGRIKACHLCAGAFQRDGCDSDSGSPLFCGSSFRDGDSTASEKNDERRNAFVVHGIFNSGLCGTQRNTPAVYARVSFYRDWIDDGMRRFGFS